MNRDIKTHISIIIMGLLSGIIHAYVLNWITACGIFTLIFTAIFYAAWDQYCESFNKYTATKKKSAIYLARVTKGYWLYLVGGSIYALIELGFRGRTHWTMMILGGVCFVVIGLLNEITDFSITTQMLLSAFVITGLEYIFGVILNIWLKLDIWDYSSQPYNVNGQVCLLFFNLWFLLSIVGIFIDDFLRAKIFGEKLPKYRL